MNFLKVSTAIAFVIAIANSAEKDMQIDFGKIVFKNLAMPAIILLSIAIILVILKIRFKPYVDIDRKIIELVMISIFLIIIYLLNL